PQGVGPQGGAFAPGLPPMPPDRVRGDIEMGRPPFAPDLRLPSRAGEPRRPPQAPPVNADEAETFQRFAQSVRPWLDAPEVEIFLTPGLPEEVVHVAERLRDALTAKGRLAVTLPDDAPAKHRMAILVGDYERNARALEILVDSPDLSRVELPGGGSVKCARSEQASGLFVVGSAEEMRRALDLLARLAAQAPDR
ncbi:MAG: hypothetical protein NTW86_30760, partial [Candidatus Sumerlaeota bacterium]|nr:hypothetical protein [Candidatus Sumerlaeota bacterium]